MKLTLLHLVQRSCLVLSIATLAVQVGTAQTAHRSAPVPTDAQARASMQGAQGASGTLPTQAENGALVRSMDARTMDAAPTPQPASKVSEPPLQSAAASLPAPAESKKQGVIHIGLAFPKADFGQGQGSDSAEALRNLMSQYLGGPKIKVVPLAARLRQQTEAEALEQGCDYILYSSLLQKKASGGMGLLRNASPMLSMVPMVGMISSASGAIAAASAASAVAGSAGAMTGQVKAKSDITFEYQLVAPGNTTPVRPIHRNRMPRPMGKT